jgi:hypothetical protein
LKVPPRRDEQVLAIVAHGVELIDVEFLRVGAGEVGVLRRAGIRQHRRRQKNQSKQNFN